MMQMKIKSKYLIGIIIAVIVLGLSYFGITGFFVKPNQVNYDNFAKCLTQKGVVLAGTNWCHFCQQQKEMFGSSFQYINFKNCDNDNWCINNGITGYPTWVFPDGKTYPGVQTLEKLAELSGCPLS